MSTGIINKQVYYTNMLCSLEQACKGVRGGGGGGGEGGRGGREQEGGGLVMQGVVVRHQGTWVEVPVGGLNQVAKLSARSAACHAGEWGLGGVGHIHREGGGRHHSPLLGYGGERRERGILGERGIRG